MPAAWRFVCGDGQPRVGRDGLGVAGSGADGVGGTAGRLRPAGVPQRLMSRFAFNAITAVFINTSPSVWSAT